METKLGGKEIPLGKKTFYTSKYNPSLLYPITREEKRKEIGIEEKLPFHGTDIWNNYELSWLNMKGKPEVAILEFRIPADSPRLIESKSLKLYFNSLNQTKFINGEVLLQTIIKDLSKEAGSSISAKLLNFQQITKFGLQEFPGVCIDTLDAEIADYSVNPKLLSCGKEIVEEELYSNLLKSNCLVTEQPDWGSVYIRYKGPKIDSVSLLKYIISFREHNEFHEQCIERIFVDLHTACKMEKLTVFGKYTRRGGIDINPFRSNFEKASEAFIRTPRQ